MSAGGRRIALVFPGQGSQSRGMLAALAARYPSVQQCFDQASAALDFDLWQLVAAGPEERLNATEFTQPAMLAAGVATWRVWRGAGRGAAGGGQRPQSGRIYRAGMRRGAGVRGGRAAGP